MRLIHFLLPSLLILLTACDDRPDQWDAFIYPDANDLRVNDTIRGFKTFELCQQAAIEQLRITRKADVGDYECGYQCGPSENFDGVNICKETRK
jgi:hypothetical protein